MLQVAPCRVSRLNQSTRPGAAGGGPRPLGEVSSSGEGGASQVVHQGPVPPNHAAATARRPGALGLAAIVLPSLYPLHSAPSSPRRRRRAHSGPMRGGDGGAGVSAKPEIAWGFMPPQHGRLRDPSLDTHDSKEEAAMCCHGLRGHHPYSAPLSTSSAAMPRHSGSTSRIAAPPSSSALAGGSTPASCCGVGCVGCGGAPPHHMPSAGQLCASAFRGTTPAGGGTARRDSREQAG